MSGKAHRENVDVDSEVGDRDRHRRAVQSDRGRSPSPVSSKRSRRTDEHVEKELIHEISSANVELTRHEKQQQGSAQLDHLYASLLPSSDYYERSYMHRDVVTHVLVTATDFLITGSQDGHIKFWKIITPDYLKQQQTAATYQSAKPADDKDPHATSVPGPIEFVKHFRAHLGSSLLAGTSPTTLSFLL